MVVLKQMVLPVIDITRDMFGQNITRVPLIILESIMLWPHDEAQRNEAMRSGSVSIIQRGLSFSHAGIMSSDAELSALAADSMPLYKMQESAQK